MAQTVWGAVEVRWLVVRDVVEGGLSVRVAADRHQVSRSQVGRWVKRYRADGLEGLQVRSTRPASSPGRTGAQVEAAVVEVFLEHAGRWGPKKIRAFLTPWLSARGLPVPATSTVAQVLARNGLSGPRQRRAARPPAGQRFERSASNELWQIDGTMHQLRNGRPFWVVDVIDDHSRYLTGALVGPAQTGELAWRTVVDAVARCGQPRQLLCDNGLTFTGRLILSPGTTVRFERQARAAGIQVIHGRPYHPQTQGKIERQHQTQNAWFADHRPRSHPEAQEVLDAYLLHYNEVRPHEAIGLVTPASRYVPGDGVQLPTQEIEPADPFPDGALPRRVSAGGMFRYRGRSIQVDARWSGLTVGVVHAGPVLHVYYGYSRIAVINAPDLTPSRRNGWHQPQ